MKHSHWTFDPHHSVNVNKLKELEHRKLSCKVLILEYDLGKSFSKEMFSKMCDTKKIDYIFKKNEKCLLYEVNPFCVRGQENDFPS